MSELRALQGTPFTGKGCKVFHLSYHADAWRIEHLVWADEENGGLQAIADDWREQSG